MYCIPQYRRSLTLIQCRVSEYLPLASDHRSLPYCPPTRIPPFFTHPILPFFPSPPSIFPPSTHSPSVFLSGLSFLNCSTPPFLRLPCTRPSTTSTSTSRDTTPTGSITYIYTFALASPFPRGSEQVFPTVAGLQITYSIDIIFSSSDSLTAFLRPAVRHTASSTPSPSTSQVTTLQVMPVPGCSHSELLLSSR